MYSLCRCYNYFTTVTSTPPPHPIQLPLPHQPSYLPSTPICLCKCVMAINIKRPATSGCSDYVTLLSYRCRVPAGSVTTGHIVTFPTGMWLLVVINVRDTTHACAFKRWTASTLIHTGFILSYNRCACILHGSYMYVGNSIIRPDS